MNSSEVKKKALVVAFYLPQYYPNRDNDSFWGPGFTEWTTVAQARPLFRGHQPQAIPGSLGFYDLRLPETRAAQAKLAREHGVHAFCYWHYWFAGRRVLNRPFREVLDSGEPRFPFCLAWSNQAWTGVWHGLGDRVLIDQTYPGDEDHERHFETLLPAFRDERYVRVDGAPLFVFHAPNDIPRLDEFVDLWQRLARQAGFPGLHLVGMLYSHHPNPHVEPLDGFMRGALPWRPWPPWARRFTRRLPRRAVRLLDEWRRSRLQVVDYENAADTWCAQPLDAREYPCIMPNWDNTPRSGRRGLVLRGSSPEKFRKPLRRAISAVADRAPDQRLVFVKSWNEWAEGNFLEPDREHGCRFLEVVADEVFETG